MRIFSGTSNKPIAERIAKELKTNLSTCQIHIFPDGERRVRIIDRVVDENTAVVQSCSAPVDQNYMELFFMVDALKRSGAKSVTAVIPYLGYQRQDHVFRSGEGVSLGVIIKTLEALGVLRLITFELHSIKIPELFHIPVEHLSALKIFAEKIKVEKWINSETILVAPDMGAGRRIKILSELLGWVPYGVIEKNRDLVTGKVTVEGMKGINQYKRAIIVDDMISSGGTIAASADFLKTKGVEEILVFATHPVFSAEAPKLLAGKKSIKKVFVTDTVDVPKNKRFSKLHILSVAQMIAEKL